MTLPRQNVLLARQAARLEEDKRAEELRRRQASPEYQAQLRLKERIDELSAKVAAQEARRAELVAEYNALPEKKAAALSNPNLTARQKYSISQNFRRKKDALKSSIRSTYNTKIRDQLKSATRAYNKGITYSQQRTAEARARSEQYRADNNIILTEKTRVNPAPSGSGTFVNDRGKTITVKEGGTGVNNAFVKEQYRIRPQETVTASVTTPLNAGRRNNPVLSPTLTSVGEEPNFMTMTGEAVYVAPTSTPTKEVLASFEPNTSTPQGAVYTAPPSYSSKKLGFFQATKERLPGALKVAGQEIKAGFFFADGIKVGDYTTQAGTPERAREGLYRVGESLNIVPFGAGFKVIQAAGKGYKLFKASKFYQGLNFGGRVGVGTSAFVGSEALVLEGTKRTAELYETEQLKIKLQNYDITPEQFRGVVSRGVADSRKTGGLSQFKDQLTTYSFGKDNLVFQSSVYGQLREYGLTEQQAKDLLPVASRTKGTREIIEAGGFVTTAGVTELAGRTAFSGANKLVNKVFTKKVLRESAFSTGGKFTNAPINNLPFSPTLTTSKTLQTSITTKGTALYGLGFGEAATQELLIQDVRQTKDQYPNTYYQIGGKTVYVAGSTAEVAKQGYLGGTAAFGLGTGIASSFELGRTTQGKGINLFANIVDPFEKPGDMLADFTTKTSKLEYNVPTITVSGTASTPTYSFGTSSTTSQEYFYGANKGQDTRIKNDELKFNINTNLPKVEEPAPIKPGKNKGITPGITSPSITTPTPAAPPAALFVNTKSRSQAPTNPIIPTDATAPIPTTPVVPIPTDPTAPIPTNPSVPIPTSPVVPIPSNPIVPIPIPVVTATPREAGFLAVGGGLGFGSGYGKKGKRLLKYTPSAYSLFTGLKGSKPSKAAIKSGFSIRPITKGTTKKKKGKKGDVDDLLSFGLRNGRKRKRKRFANF